MSGVGCGAGVTSTGVLKQIFALLLAVVVFFGAFSVLSVSVSAADNPSPLVNLLDTTTPDDSGSLVVAVPPGRWITHNFKLPVGGTIYYVDFVISAPDDIKAFVAVAPDDWHAVSWSKISSGLWYGSVAIPGQDATSIDIQLHSPNTGLKAQFHSVNVSYQPYSAFDIKSETSLSGSDAAASPDDYYMRTANRNLSWSGSVKRFDMLKVRLRTSGWTLGSFTGFVTGQFPVPVTVNAINSAPGGQVDMLIELTVDLRSLDKSHMDDLIIQTVGKYQGQFGYSMYLVSAHGFIFTSVPDSDRGVLTSILNKLFHIDKVLGWMDGKQNTMLAFIRDTMQASIASIDRGIWAIKNSFDQLLNPPKDPAIDDQQNRFDKISQDLQSDLDALVVPPPDLGSLDFNIGGTVSSPLFLSAIFKSTSFSQLFIATFVLALGGYLLFGKKR